jgi:hypothetical protein
MSSANYLFATSYRRPVMVIFDFLPLDGAAQPVTTSPKDNQHRPRGE